VSERDIEIEPEQPAEVAGAVAELLDDGAPDVAPWWRAGVDANLDGYAERISRGV